MINYTLDDVIAANVDTDDAMNRLAERKESAAAITLAYMKQAEAEGLSPYEVRVEAARQYGWACPKTPMGNGLYFKQDGTEMPKSLKQRFSTCCKAYDRGVVFAEIATFAELTPKKSDDPRVKAVRKWAAEQVKDGDTEALDHIIAEFNITV